MPVWIDPDEVRRYSLKEDADLADAPVFLIGIPTARDQDAITAEFIASREQDATARGIAISSVALRGALRGWECWKKPDGTLVEFPKGDIDRALTMIPATVRAELGGIALEMLRLTSGQRD